jgi:predicted HTH transcriptional regulator
MFAERICGVRPDDINRMIAEEWAESVELEFKAGIPARRGPELWSERREINEFSRDKILRKIVAFANAHGGTLVLGIDESDDDPKRAKARRPLPDCHDLAKRLENGLRSGIEPRLAFVECKGVALSGDGAGIVIIRVPASKLEPHWVTGLKDATFRRGANSVSMTMSEIHDLTIKLVRDAEATEREFDRRELAYRERFHAERVEFARARQLDLPKGSALAASVMGVHIAVLPLD